MIQEKNDVYKEVLTILAYFSEDMIEKIPAKVFIKLTELSADSKSDFYIDTEKNLYDQNLSEEAKDLIALIYYGFIADEKEKNELLREWNINENEYQEKLKDLYDIDKLFQNRQGKNAIFAETTSVSNTAMVQHKKETLFDRIKNFIKNILKDTK